MSTYSKLLMNTKIQKKSLTNVEFSDFTNNGKYSFSQIMQEMFSQGFTQVIINTHLMLKIIEEAFKNHWELIDLVIEDPSVDKETIEEIKIIVGKLKSNKIYYQDLESYLIWALDGNSIFIDKIHLGKKKDGKIVQSLVYSSGLLDGTANSLIFDEFLKKVIEEYLNG